MSELSVDQLSEAERAAIKRDNENRILRLELDCLLHFSGIEALDSLRIKGDER